MKVLLMVAGWLLLVAGLLVLVLSIVDGPSKPGNAVTANPGATAMVAGAVLILASVLSGRGEVHSRPTASGPPTMYQPQPPMPGQQGAAPHFPPSGGASGPGR